MVLDSDTTFMDGSESTVSTTKPRQKKKKFNSPYKTKSGLPKQFDPDKRREQWLKDLRSGNGRTMSGRAITGTTGTGGASTSRSGKSTTSAVGSARSVKVTVNTDADDAAFLSTSKYLQKKLLENHIGGGGAAKVTASKASSAYGPSSKDPADMADEIVELKRKLALVESTINQSKGRMRRLEEENSRKDKQIEQLLNPGGSDDTRRSLAERGGGESSSVVNSLKNRNIKLELTLKEKENELRKLKEDVKTTRAEEMKICMEAFYQEIIRLRAAVHTGKKTTLGTDSSKQDRGDDFASNRKMKTLNANVLRLSELNKDLESENERLKRELDSVKDSLDRPESGDMEDMTREQLLDTAYKLQQKLDRYDEVMADQLDEEKPKLPGKMKLEGSFAERFAALDRRESELLQEVEKNKSSLSRLRDEGDDWRTKYEDVKKECEKLKEAQHQEAMRKTSTMNSIDFPSKAAQRSTNDPNMSAIGSEDLQGESSSLAEERRRRQQREDDEEWRRRGLQAMATSTNTTNRERERESTRGRGRKGSNASSPDISVSTKGSDQIDSAADRKSEKFESTVQLQSILRAHMSRCQSKPVSTAGGTSRARSTGGGGSVVQSRPSSSLGRGGSPGRGTSDRKTNPESDNESTARTMTARSGRLDPISDRSDEGGASSSASGWGDVHSPASLSRKTSPAKPKFGNDIDSPIGSPKAKPRTKVKKELSSESDVNETPKKGNSKMANDNSDTDVTTPRPAKRNQLSDDENFFGF